MVGEIWCWKGCNRHVVDPHWRHRFAECFQWLVRLIVYVIKRKRTERDGVELEESKEGKRKRDENEEKTRTVRRLTEPSIAWQNGSQIRALPPITFIVLLTLLYILLILRIISSRRIEMGEERREGRPTVP